MCDNDTEVTVMCSLPVRGDRINCSVAITSLHKKMVLNERLPGILEGGLRSWGTSTEGTAQSQSLVDQGTDS